MKILIRSIDSLNVYRGTNCEPTQVELLLVRACVNSMIFEKLLHVQGNHTPSFTAQFLDRNLQTCSAHVLQLILTAGTTYFDLLIQVAD